MMWEGALMAEPRDNNLDYERSHADEPASEVDVLIGRFVDGEARAADIDRFAVIVGARDESSLRSLLERKREHALLRGAIDADLSRADNVDLPEGIEWGGRSIASAAREAAKYIGWAAALALALVLAFGERREAPPVQVIDRERMEPHIVGERELGVRLNPMLTQTEKLPDGRYLLTIIERRARQIYLDHLEEEWIRQEEAPTQLDPSPPPPDDL